MENSIKNMSGGKVKPPYWFYLIIILIPILFFILLETGLRIFDYGRNDNQWITVSETMQMLNPEIGGRYFINTKNFPQSNNEAFDITKKKNAFRIFVLGGSSTAGFPYSPNGSFSRYIRDALKLLYPDKRIEVINVAITATNSYTISDLLPGVVDQNPDLILIYAGHNEYYGALGVGSMENLGSSREVVHLLIWLNKFKTVELLRNIFSSFSGLLSDNSVKNPERGGTLMARIVDDQYIALNSEKFNTGIDQFENNLEDILQTAEDANIPVVIGSLISNLKDQHPFVSINEAKQERADTVFAHAQIQFALNNIKTADSLFRLAKDLDALRFRAPEKLNSLIFNLAQKYECGIVNLDSVFSAESPNGIVGNNLLVDHLHPTLDGQFLIGKSFLEVMDKLNYMPEIESHNFSEVEIDSIVISNFAFSSLDSKISQIRLTGLLNDWPFVDKPDFSFLKHLELKNKIDSIAFGIAVKNQNWEMGHKQAAKWYLDRRDYKNFSNEMNVLTSQYPFKLSFYDQASSELLNVKEYKLAYQFLLKRFIESPDAFSSKWLGNINLHDGNLDSAIKFLKESNKIDGSDAQVLYNLAGAYIQKEEYKVALDYLKKCIKLNSDFPNANNLKSQLTKLIEQ